MSKNTLNPMQRFWLLIKPDRKEIRNIYVYAVFYGLVYLSLPVGIQAIINLIQGGQISTSWVVLVSFVIAGILFTGVLQVLQLRITENLQQKIFTRAAFEFTYRIPRIKLVELYKHYAPELMNRFFDVVSVQKGLSKILIDFSIASVQTVFGLVLLSLYHPFFIVYGLVLVALVYSIFRLTAKKGLDTSLAESKEKYRVVHWLEELARTSVSFKLAGETELPMKKTNGYVEEYIEDREAHFKILKTQYILMIVFKVLVAAGLLVIGSILVIEQQMNIGQFVASEIIILMVLGSVEKLVLSLETIYDILTSLEKLGQVTDLELEITEGIESSDKIDPEAMEVAFSNLSFRYPGQSEFIFHKANLSISPGEKVMVTGDNESGKTTLLYLLAGLYPIHSGTVLYNGIPFGNINPEKLRSTIGDCLMDELLFEGTLLENITMGREKASLENVKWAIKNLKLSSFIEGLPDGYNTQINPQGKQFSRSIIDKLLLARSIADRPSLLLIRDAFPSLFGEDREEIMSFLVNPENKWTLVIASQNLDLANKVDRVISVEENILIENKSNHA